MPFINLPELLARMATARGIDPDGLIKTPQDIQAEQQAAQEAQQQQMMAELAGKAAPAGIKAMSDQVLAAGQAQAPQG
jgi:hypothetical protein